MYITNLLTNILKYASPFFLVDT